MTKPKHRDDFSPKTKLAIAKRASYICSNPDCRCLTLCPSDVSAEDVIYIGKVAHIIGASPNGPRYDSSFTATERSSGDNAIFLCSNCADMIDKNQGQDFSAQLLRSWRAEHEAWVKGNLNKSPWSLVSIISGEHHASGKGKVTTIDVQEPSIITPGTKSTAEGEGEVTALRIRYKGGGDK